MAGAPEQSTNPMADTEYLNQSEEALGLAELLYRTLFNSIDEGFCIIEVRFNQDSKAVDYRFLEVNPAFERQTGIKNATGRWMREIAPQHEEHWFEIYGEIARTGESRRFENPAKELGYYYDVYAFRYGNPGENKVALLFKDISERKKYEHYSRILYQVTSELSAAISQDQLVRALHKGMRAMGVQYGVIAVVSEEDQDSEKVIRIINAFGSSPDVDQSNSIPLNHPKHLLAYAIRENKPLWLSRGEVVIEHENHSTNATYEGIDTTDAILPFARTRLLSGALVLKFDAPRNLHQVERDTLLILAENFSQALRRTQLNEKLQQMATFEERQRLSRDLHDSVQQLLFASINLASALPKLWSMNTEKAQKSTLELIDLNKAALAEIHTLLYELRPDSITQTPFVTLLNNLGFSLKGHKFINMSLRCDVPQGFILPPEMQVAMYRIAQEVLNNVAKHSNATQVEIDCTYDERVFRLVIQDNGQGFDTSVAYGGLGLKTLRERAVSVGASLKVESEIDAGTIISIALPYSRESR